MRLPIQSQPVRRGIPSQPFADGQRGVAPSEYGVQPSDWLGDLLKKGIINYDVPIDGAGAFGI